MRTLYVHLTVGAMCALGMIAGPAAMGIDITAADGSQNLYTNAAWQTLKADGGTHTITPSGSTYDWASRTGGDPGLNLGTNMLYTGDGNAGAYTLDLDGGNITGTAAYKAFYKNGPPSSSYNDSASIFIKHVGSINIGGMDFRPGKANWGQRSDITIGEPAGTGSGPATGDVQVGYLLTYFSVAEAGSDPAKTGYITIYSLGNVWIRSGVTPGNILTYCESAIAGQSDPNGTVAIYHDGAFEVGNIDTHIGPTDDYNSYPGHVTLEGDYSGNGPNGICTVGNIYAQNDAPYTDWRAAAGGNVSISGYSSVTVSNISTWSPNAAWNNAGNVTISNITGNITINGALDLHSNYGSGNGGNLTLSCRGKIVLAGLDLGGMNENRFTTGVRRTYDFVQIKTSPLGLTYNGTQVSGFTALNSHVYYTDTNGGVEPNGSCHIYIGGVDSGFDLIEGRPPAAGTVVFVR